MAKTKNIERQTVDDGILILELKTLFNKGILGKEKCKEALRTKFTLQTQRYYRLYNQTIYEWLGLNEVAINNTITSLIEEGLKKGVDSKNADILSNQNKIERLEKQLNGELKFTFTISGKTFKSHLNEEFVLPIEKQLEIEATIKELKMENRKMLGYYSPKKIELQEDIIIEVI